MKNNLNEMYLACVEETIPVKDSRNTEGGYRKFSTTAHTEHRLIERFCKDNGTGEPSFFATAFALALKSYTASEGVFFSCISNGRSIAVNLNCDVKETVLSKIGYCEDFLKRISENDDYSYEDICAAYNLKGTVCLDLDGNSDTGRAVQLIIRILKGDAGISYECEFDSGVFSEYTVNGLIRTLDNITGEFLTKERFEDVCIALKDDEEKILNLYDAASPYEDKPGYRHLQDSAGKYPDRTALIAIDRTLTYKELNEEANALGHVLRANGAGIESKIAVMADRNSYGYVMREGALKSGGAFMSIDPEYPEERIKYILEDSDCKLLVTTEEIINRKQDLIIGLQEAGVCVVNVTKAVKEGCRNDLNIDVPGDALAYVIYTSGSTGKPKGVMIENRNLANFVDDNIHNKEARVFTKFGRVTLAIAAFTFDVSVLEEFVPLGHGQTVVLATMDQIMDADKMKDLILDNNVVSMTCTPTYMLNLTEIESFAPAIRSLKSIDIGSEAFPPVLYEKLAAINPGLYVCNSYGPTECCVTCTLKELHSNEDITIGYPLSNVKTATFDRDGRLQVPGALGELVIMGAGVGRGYIGRDDLNERNFITLLGLPAYRSGDLVRIMEDGDIEFHGRIDNQVKLRGLRVELGEIESVLGSYPGVRSCIVIVAHGETDYLAAYFTADEKVDIKSLKTHLSSYLTSYMVPQAYLQLDEMPMNLSGKIDKKALPEAVMTEDEIIPPENETQERLLEAVKEVIGDIPLGITSDLLGCGLSSVSSIRLCALIRERFGRLIRTSEIFENNTIRDIERLIDSKEEEKEYELMKEYPLSMTQTGIYFECMRYPGATTYNLPELHKLGLGVDLKKLSAAIEKAVAAHPYLFMDPVRDKDGTIHAVRRDDLSYKAPIIKCDRLPSADELVRAFALDSGELLFRAEIYETGDGNYFFLDTHHIISDGASLDILKRDIDRAYCGEEIEKEKYSGYEFALDEKAARESGRLEKAKSWYDSIFAGCGGETTPVKDGNIENGHIGFELVYGNADGDRIRRFCEENSYSLNAFFVTAFGLALKSYTCSENAVFTTIYNGRSDDRLKDSVSMLVKTLPVYLECAPEMNVSQAIEDCQKFLLSAMANDIYSFAEIRNAYGIKADIMMVFQGEYEHGARIGGEFAQLKTLGISRSIADLGIDVSLDGSKVVYELEYDPSVYSKYTVSGLTHMMDNVISGLMRAELIKDIVLTDEEDIRKIKNLHDSSFPVKERPAYRLLQDSAKKYPERKAVVAKDRTLTYKGLNEEANALGCTLRENGAGPESIIAVMPKRNSYAYVLRQGVLKSGGAFLPIDPEYPEDRIRFILEDSGAGILAAERDVFDSRRDMFDAIAASGIRLICVEDAISEGNRSDINAKVPYDALAYVIYTSGSTGKPKGVMLTNRNLVNFVDDDEKNHEIQGYTGRGHVSLAIAALTFDFSIMEEFVPIANGMTVVLADHDDIMNPIMLSKLMTDNGVDVMSCTPSYIMNMLDMGEYTDVFTNAVKALRSIDLGAEAFPAALFDKLKEINPDICIMNGYGPTEATISCTMKVIEDTANITIGIPNVNVHVATVDRDGRLQGLGAMGEMVIMGEGVGRGYIGRDDLNRKNFIRMLDMPAYRSGDLVRITENGDIEYHGRIDNQVKLRGLRVELGEIESVINSYPGVRSSIVIVIKKETEYLAAYFTADEEIDTDRLKDHLASQLTAYMVPQTFTQLDEMPLTANGKIDKKALPQPGTEEIRLTPPENERQKVILEMIKDIVGDVPIGITTDIFAAGLSSLGCIRLCTALSQKFEKTIRISEIFENNTVKNLEKLLGSKQNDEGYEIRRTYPLSMTQMGIFVESIHYAGTTVYNMPFLYELDKETDMGQLRLAVEKTLKAHPYLSMTLERNEEGDVFAVRSEGIMAEITEGKSLPDAESLIRPFDLPGGEPLSRFGLYDTDKGKYLFIDTHHLVSDGESMDILLNDINEAYMGGEPEAERYTGFEAALTEETDRSSGKLEQAKEWYDRLLAECGNVTLPPVEENDGEISGTGFSTLTGKTDAHKIRKFCDGNRIGLNAFFTTAMGLALRVCSGAGKAVFASIYNGRNDSRLSNSIAMFVKTIPVCLDLLPETKVTEAINECQTIIYNDMACDILSFAEICSSYGLNPDVLFAFQGERNTDDSVMIGGKPAKEKELVLPQEQAKSPFGLDITMDSDRVFYEFEYDPSKYGNKTVERFYRIMEAVINGLMSEETIGEVLDSHDIKELSKKPAVEGKTDENPVAEKSVNIHVVLDDAMELRQLEVLKQHILEIYRKVLNDNDLKPDDDFFEHGGTSLLAAKVMMAVMVKDYPVVYQDIFDTATPGKLAELVFAKMREDWSKDQPDHEQITETDMNSPDKGFEKVLSHNTAEFVDNIRREDPGVVLITGATGFLGIHVLRELIETGTKKIYCLVHSSSVSAGDRLKQNFFYYFDDLDEELLGTRVIPIDGDITDKETVRALSGYDIDTVINCAASVKHFAELDFLEKINVHGVRNLVDLCVEKKMRLIHISTVSVAGDSIGKDGRNAVLSESTFDIGQEVRSNAYVYTKYLADKLVLEAIDKKGLDAKIIRMGNLMSRYEDGEFQINFSTNNFMNTLKAYSVLGCFPVQELDEVEEFSPIDEVAKATVLLAGTNREFTVFHAYNSHSVEMGDVIRALRDNDLKIDIVDAKEYEERLKSALADETINSYVAPLVNYRTDNDDLSRENDVENRFTVKALHRLGFQWDITGRDYIDNSIAMLKSLGFFDVR